MSIWCFTEIFNFYIKSFEAKNFMDRSVVSEVPEIEPKMMYMYIFKEKVHLFFVFSKGSCFLPYLQTHTEFKNQKIPLK